MARIGVNAPVTAMSIGRHPSEFSPLSPTQTYFITLDVTRNDLVFLMRDRQLPGQVDKRLRIR